MATATRYGPLMSKPQSYTLGVPGAVLRYDECGMPGDPDGFARTLRRVLDEEA